MAIILEPIGGLGNQLFIYSLARELQKTLKVEVFFSLRNYEKKNNFKYELDSFKDGKKIKIVKKIPKSLLYNSSIFNQIMAKFPSLRYLGLPNLYYEKNLEFSPEIFSLTDTTIVRGFFQSWRYFDESKYELNIKIRDLVQSSLWYDRKKEELDKKGRFTAIHVRGGDYKSSKSIGTLTKKYYKNAVKVLQDTGEYYPDPVFFTDDIPMLQELFNFGIRPEQIFIAPHDSRPLESLLLMSMAKSKIIANSTFSWWGAYLGGGTVIAPKPWFRNLTHNYYDLIPPDWLIIDT